MENPTKIDDLGGPPLFLKTPIYSGSFREVQRHSSDVPTGPTYEWPALIFEDADALEAYFTHCPGLNVAQGTQDTQGVWSSDSLLRKS